MDKDTSKPRVNNKLDGNKEKGGNKGIKNMDAIKINKNEGFIPKDLQKKINKVSSNTVLLKGKNNMIELDPNNPQHVEWYEKDEYKGE